MTSLKQLKELRRLQRLGGQRIKLQPIKSWNIFKGDIVEVLSGHDKGKQGIVQAIDQDVNSLYVKGLNTKVVEKQSEQLGIFDGYLEQEKPLHYSNVALVDPEDGKVCRVKFVYNTMGKRVRVSTRSNRILPFPVKEKDDYMDIIAPEGPSNTVAAEVVKQTYTPSFTMFEEDIGFRCGLMPIQESASEDFSPQASNKTEEKSLWKKLTGQK